METNNKLDELADILFAGENRAKDIKIMPGSDQNKNVEQVADALLESLRRMGIVKDDDLVSTK